MSEDNCATLNYVFERWMAIQTKLSAITKSGNCFAKDIEAFMIHEQGKPWKERLDRQLTSLHTAAYFLQPQTFDASMTEKSQEEIYKAFKQYILLKHEEALKQFYDFCRQRGAFYPGNRAWTFQDPALFWAYMQTTSPDLASFADKLMNTCANSVTSERAWSTMNYIHSKTRNKLSVERTDKLQFIYISIRTLRKLNGPDKTLEELLVMEDKFLGMQ